MILRHTSKILVAAILALTLMASVVAAANVAGRCRGRGITLPQFARMLSLTQEQTTEVGGILTRFRQDVKAVITSDRTREAKRADIMGLREQARNSINSVLTADQKEKASVGDLVGRLLMHRKGGAGLRQALASLDLTPDQKTQIRGIMQDSKARAKAVRQDTSLTKQDKMAKLKEIRRGTIESISSVLTPDQRAKFEQWLKNRRPGRPAAGVRVRAANSV